MMLASVLLKTYGMLLWNIHGPATAVCWIASLVTDVLWARAHNQGSATMRRACAADVILANVATVLVGLVANVAFLEATVRWKDGIPVFAKLAADLFNALHLPVAAFDGIFYITSMSGPLEIPVGLDGLAVMAPTLMAAITLVYLLLSAPRWMDVVSGTVWIVVVLLAVTLLRWIFNTGMFFYFCDFIGNESEELPIAPFLRPGPVAAIYLPFLILGAVVLHRRLSATVAAGASASRRVLSGPAWAWLALAVLLTAVFWQPTGERKSGTVLINTFHTQWSRSDRPYDRTWFGPKSGYNYACLKRLFERFYDVRELRARITADDLADASVLIIYVPDQAFTAEERDAILKFVERGGGLFLIGDHTNVFGSSSNLNGICRDLGLRFRDDVLFDLDEDFFQLVDIPALHSPLLHGMDFFKFRGPASIRPTSWSTRTVFRVGNAKSLRAIYSVNNFYPPPRDNPKMWTGEFSSSVASHHGQGRILAFADSTIFSNFEIFYPGKYEFLLNGVEWLHHADSFLRTPLRRSSMIGIFALLAYLLWRARTPRKVLGTVLVGIVVAGTSWIACAYAAQTRAAFPEPVRPLDCLFFASEPPDEAYRLKAFVTDSAYDKKYDIFIQWVLRNDMFAGFYLSGPAHDNELFAMLTDAEQADAGIGLIVTRDDHLPILRTLRSGPTAEVNRVLILVSSSMPWDEVKAALTEGGILSSSELIAEAEAAMPDGTARLEDGDRRIAIVFSSERFSDINMGFSEKTMPNEVQTALFQEEYDLLDWLFERPVAPPPPAVEDDGVATEETGNSASEAVP